MTEYWRLLINKKRNNDNQYMYIVLGTYKNSDTVCGGDWSLK